MLIITADDWGKNAAATDRGLTCFRSGRITSVSAMVFMRDSERAAGLALEAGVEAGLHLNFSTPFDGAAVPDRLLAHQSRLASFLERSRFAPVVYNPFLRNEFEYVCRAQHEEFARLYGAGPAHFNGHRHKHLCMNVLMGGLIARGSKVRRTFTFHSGEKNALNLMYRRLIDRMVERRYVCTDAFFSVAPVDGRDRLRRIVSLSAESAVELMVHPERDEERDFLMRDEYLEIISRVRTGNYGLLHQAGNGGKR
ncbi:MAG: hypothetical protein Kow0025_05100 [Thermodesulfovibrionales bacterium]